MSRRIKMKQGPAPLWLVLMHQLQPKPESLRVRVWRMLQRMGAVAVKNSVYVLPNKDSCRKSLFSLIEDIHASGGDAFVCEAKFIIGLTDENIIQQFNEVRNAEYSILSNEIKKIDKIISGKKITTQENLMQIEHVLGKLRRQFNENASLDFFNSSTKNHIENELNFVESKIAKLRKGENYGQSQEPREKTLGRTWVTRQNLFVDRLASSWLIKKFIDPQANFKFINPERYRHKKGELRFDMFNAEFTHEGDLCTFEVLVKSFHLKEPALRAMSEIIHDIDLNDSKFEREETSGIKMLIGAMAKSEKSDERRLERSFVLFDDLYSSLREK